mmetsp:Transcript_111673/g.322789  ORF Transcript_111673/g.322789 Transcript_111673/m.322789 type:complete len:210 (-) Transcript_111673:267-896(-)
MLMDVNQKLSFNSSGRLSCNQRHTNLLKSTYKRVSSRFRMCPVRSVVMPRVSLKTQVCPGRMTFFRVSFMRKPHNRNTLSSSWSEIFRPRVSAAASMSRASLSAVERRAHVSPHSQKPLASPKSSAFCMPKTFATSRRCIRRRSCRKRFNRSLTSPIIRSEGAFRFGSTKARNLTMARSVSVSSPKFVTFSMSNGCFRNGGETCKWPCS